MKYLRYLFAALSLVICLALTYETIDYALDMLDKGVIGIQPGTVSDVILSLLIFLPLVFLAVFLKKSKQRFDIIKPLGVMLLFGLMMSIVEFRLSENPGIINELPKIIESQGDGIRRFIPVLILPFLFGLSEFLLGRSLIHVQYYDRKIKGFRISLQISGLCLMSLVGIFLYDFFLAVAYGYLALFFLTSHIDFCGSKEEAAVSEGPAVQADVQ